MLCGAWQGLAVGDRESGKQSVGGIERLVGSDGELQPAGEADEKLRGDLDTVEAWLSGRGERSQCADQAADDRRRYEFGPAAG